MKIDPEFTLVKYTKISETQRTWLDGIENFTELNGIERETIISVLRRGEYNAPAKNVLNEIRKRVMEINSNMENL